MTIDEIENEIARCDREIAEMESQPPTQPAYLTTLGIEDWRRERRILLAMMPPDPNHPGKHIDPSTKIWPIEEWGNSVYRGFVSDSRFGSGPVIKRTRRDVTRAWRRSQGSAR